MKKFLRWHEELAFTTVAYSLLVLVLLTFLAVRWRKETYASLLEGPGVLSLHPGAIVSGAEERVTVLSERTHFGPWTTLRSEVPGVFLTNIRFVSERELSFEVYVHDRGDPAAGREIPLAIRSPVGDGKLEEVRLALSLRSEAEPLELDLFNFEGKDSVSVEGDYVMFGYRPRGYAPFRLRARNLETEDVVRQETRNEIEHLGVPLEPGENPFELTLADALGREVKKLVTIFRRSEEIVPASFLATARAEYALTGTYSGKPTQWNASPGEQMAAADCALGNGPLGCASGCGGGIHPPPKDYVATLGQANIGGDGVLLHNGQFRDDKVDLYIPGRGLDFVWRRSYQSGIDLDGYLGKNWDFSWGAHFSLESQSGNPGKGHFSRGDGRRDVYDNAQVESGGYVYTTVPTGYVDIKTSVVTTASEIRQTKRNGLKQIFDKASGTLKSREDRYGNKISVIYDASGRLSRFQDTLDRYVDAYFGGSGAGAAAGRLTKITDFAGRSVTYEFAEVYTNGPVVLTKVLYPPTDWFDDTTNPWTERTNTSRTESFLYDTTYARLTSVADGRGKERVKNVYDASGRVDYQFNGCAHRLRQYVLFR